ncbi:hypothetical protein BT63DRAFT_419665, partial [Microthyrium microscopicum]
MANKALDKRAERLGAKEADGTAPSILPTRYGFSSLRLLGLLVLCFSSFRFGMPSVHVSSPCSCFAPVVGFGKLEGFYC